MDQMPSTKTASPPKAKPPNILMILRGELEGPLRGDELEPLYLAVASRRLDRAVFIDGDPPALLLLG